MLLLLISVALLTKYECMAFDNIFLKVVVGIIVLKYIILLRRKTFKSFPMLITIIISTTIYFVLIIVPGTMPRDLHTSSYLVLYTPCRTGTFMTIL